MGKVELAKKDILRAYIKQYQALSSEFIEKFESFNAEALENIRNKVCEFRKTRNEKVTSRLTKPEKTLL
jgi:hypothetical protein